MPIPVTIGSPPEKNSIVYRSLDINDPDDEENDTYKIEDISEQYVFQQGIEPFPDRDGAQTYEPFNMFKVFRVRGWVYGPTLARLYDKIEAINEAFHPVKAFLADDSDFNPGYLPIKFDVPTADTANYPTGLIACEYFVHALSMPVDTSTKFVGLAARIDFMLRAADPRRYFQTASNNSRIGDGTLDLDNTLATYPSWPIIKIETGATVTGDWTITLDSGEVITIDATALDINSTYYLDLQANTFREDDDTDVIAALDPESEFFQLASGAVNTVTIASTSSSPQITVYWNRAFI